jgi:hypothetical protein
LIDAVVSQAHELKSGVENILQKVIHPHSHPHS